MKRRYGIQVFAVPDSTQDLWFEPDPEEISEAAGVFSNPEQAMPELESLKPKIRGGLKPGEPWWTTASMRARLRALKKRGAVQDVYPFQVLYGPKKKQKKRPMTMAEVRGVIPTLDEFRRNLYISCNSKTFWSINHRISNTSVLKADLVRLYGTDFDIPDCSPSCRPTEWCTWSCYAKSGRMMDSSAQRIYLANRLHYEWLATTPLDAVIESVDEQYEFMQRNWRPHTRQRRLIGPMQRMNIRLLGSGDLVPGMVRWILVYARRHPDVILWGMTRRVDMLRLLDQGMNRLPNKGESIRFQVSTDPSTPFAGSRGWKSNPFEMDAFAPILRRRGWNYCHATHLSGDEFLAGLRARGFPVKTVFGWHRGRNHTHLGDPYECPATNPVISKYYEDVNWGEWYRRQQRGSVAFSVCQVCRWCMTANVSKEGTREEITGHVFPAEVLNDPYFIEGASKGALPPLSEIPARSNPWLNPETYGSLQGQMLVDQERIHPFFRS